MELEGNQYFNGPDVWCTWALGLIPAKLKSSFQSMPRPGSWKPSVDTIVLKYYYQTNSASAFAKWGERFLVLSTSASIFTEFPAVLSLLGRGLIGPLILLLTCCQCRSQSFSTGLLSVYYFLNSYFYTIESCICSFFFSPSSSL